MVSTRTAGTATSIGLLLILASWPTYVFSVQATRTTGLRDIEWFSYAPITLTPSTNSQLADIIDQGLYLVLAMVSNTVLFTGVLGLVLFGIGGSYFVRRYLYELYRTGFLTSTARVLWVVVLGSIVLVASPTARRATFEVTSILLASGTVMVLSGAVLIAAEDRAGPLATVVLIGPAALSTLFLSVVAGMFASTTFRNLMVRVTDEFVEFMLLEVFATVGLNEPLTELFTLQGVAYFAVWVSVTATLGVLLGVVLLVFDISIKRSARRYTPYPLN